MISLRNKIWNTYIRILLRVSIIWKKSIPTSQNKLNIKWRQILKLFRSITNQYKIAILYLNFNGKDAKLNKSKSVMKKYLFPQTNLLSTVLVHFFRSIVSAWPTFTKNIPRSLRLPSSMWISIRLKISHYSFNGRLSHRGWKIFTFIVYTFHGRRKRKFRSFLCRLMGHVQYKHRLATILKRRKHSSPMSIITPIYCVDENIHPHQ